MSFDEPSRLTIVAEGTLSALEPVGRERIARRLSSYCEVSHVSMV